jgi:signal peptidase II
LGSDWEHPVGVEQHRSPGPRFFLAVFLVALFDQATKLWVAREMIEGESRRVLGEFLKLTYVQNEGAAFGLSLGGRWSFIVVTILVGVFILVYYSRSERTPLSRLALAMILGGALGNLVDRIRIGEVIDFLHVSVRGFSWPVFNVADIGVTVGVGLLALHLFRKEHPPEASPDVAEDVAAEGQERNDGDDASRGADPAAS